MHTCHLEEFNQKDIHNKSAEKHFKVNEILIGLIGDTKKYRKHLYPIKIFNLFFNVPKKTSFWENLAVLKSSFVFLYNTEEG